MWPSPVTKKPMIEINGNIIGMATFVHPNSDEFVCAFCHGEAKENDSALIVPPKSPNSPEDDPISVLFPNTQAPPPTTDTLTSHSSPDDISAPYACMWDMVSDSPYCSVNVSARQSAHPLHIFHSTCLKAQFTFWKRILRQSLSDQQLPPIRCPFGCRPIEIGSALPIITVEPSTMVPVVHHVNPPHLSQRMRIVGWFCFFLALAGVVILIIFSFTNVF
eukprot:c1646_g1_i1.p1 GENE.c1646_g1_i1~~c1646_g1_i1.p1  ORF type:complete len:219 (+),score=34.84 c1646_g1_i1:3-659(+)